MDRLKRFSRKKRFEKWLWLAKVGDVRTVDGTKSRGRYINYTAHGRDKTQRLTSPKIFR